MPSEFELKIIRRRLKNCFSSNHFSICDVDACMKLLGVPRGQDYKALHALHCVNWEEMGDDLAAEVKEKVLRLLLNGSFDDQKIDFLFGDHSEITTRCTQLEERHDAMFSRMRALEKEAKAGMFKKFKKALMGGQ